LLIGSVDRIGRVAGVARLDPAALNPTGQKQFIG
jgi:hypothetical protein